jgi:hypothetical protein
LELYVGLFPFDLLLPQEFLACNIRGKPQGEELANSCNQPKRISQLGGLRDN